MTTQTVITLSPDDLRTMLGQLLFDQKSGTTRHAYTVAQAAEQIGYKPATVREFIREGRKGRNGRLVRLQAKEITAGDYRILPADLDEFINQF